MSVIGWIIKILRNGYCKKGTNMSKKQQLLDLIGSIEDEALKTKLSTVADGAFTDIESIKNDAIESRDKVKDKLKASNSMLNDIKSELKLDDDFQVTDITERIKKNSNTDEIEARFEAITKALFTKPLVTKPSTRHYPFSLVRSVNFFSYSFFKIKNF